MKLKAEKQREEAWDDLEVTSIGLKIVVLEGFYTFDEINQDDGE
jgi:hypothetical protein